jgi:outer membrane protein OmpA-like peptidoglycan-associated protein
MEVHMNKLIVRTGLLGLVTAAAFALGGCTNTLKEENAQLRENNAKLETESSGNLKMLEQERAARSEAEGKAQQNQAEVARLQTELATKSQPQNPPAWTNNEGTKGTKGGKSNTGGGSIRTVLAGDVLFSPGSVVLTSAGKKEIDKVIADIKSHHSGDSIRVEGYTDTDPPKKVADKYPTNKALSLARAKSVEAYMASKGISASRIDTVGMGEAKPMGTKAASRRVEIVIVDTN